MSHALTSLPRRVAAVSPILPVLAVPALLALPLTPDGAGPADLASGLAVVYCVIRLLRERRRPLSPTAVVVLGLPVVGLALAAMGASSPEAGLTGLGRYLQIFVLVPAAVLLLIRDRFDFRLLAWSFVGLALCQGAVGVHQYVTRTGASYQGQDMRAVGTFGAHDVMGMATTVSLGVVCAVGIALGRGPVRQRALATGCALVLLAPLALSFSRGAWIATALTCGVQLGLTGLRRALKVAAAVTAAGVVLVGGLGIGTAALQQRIDSITQVTDAPDQSVVDRYALWASATGIWRQEPLTGVGIKGFPDHRDRHATLALSSGSDIGGAGSAYQRQPLLSPHNMYLLLLSEQGLVGLLALAGSWLALLVCGLRRLLRVRDRGPGADCGLVACGLLLWLLTDFVYGDIGGPSTVLTAVGLGLVAWWALTGDERVDAPRSETRVRVEEALAR
ncbi:MULTISPECIES: O-antigen ligase family protein [Streptomyces]|uniref:O-antigen ligase domain-containing protein n=1 Tax=Streptomyces cadmiisoli TaxID=2184053 RepID=A0A2Z4J3B9_9ACTN|nr:MULTISPECIES: O-antigen ligase family protein [Streptomyces]AWW39507.1 O-antigen ligase domain-containing protein [Streptomyces cadmiisoli]